MKIRYLITGFLCVLFLAAIALFLFRHFAYQHSFRLCSDKFAYNFYFEEGFAAYDDGIMADQTTPIRQCSSDIELRHCFTSFVKFLDPSEVDQEDAVPFEYTVEEAVDGTMVTIFDQSSIDEDRITYIRFDSSGQFLSLTTQTTEETTRFSECTFPFFR